MSFACGATCCTFVSSMTTNGGETKESGGFIDPCFETFHEIIYGKSERGAKVRRVFFCPFLLFSLFFVRLKQSVLYLEGRCS